jgi:hypothetical protein
MGILLSADLLDLAIKQKLIGATLYFEDGTTKVIDDYEIDSLIKQMCLKFTDNSNIRVNYVDKVKIDTVDVVVRHRKGKVKRTKKH